ncbi:MAG: glycoside hydrolase family 15 protein, partial [Gemmatimonadales bacterium]
LVEIAGGFLAAGAFEDVRAILGYLRSTQESDGHWAQNMWLDGTPYWNGVQMDETALPVLLVDLAQRDGGLPEPEAPRYWPMVRAAAGYILRNGPVSPQDRWEEDAGFSPFTVGAEIAALLAAADLAERCDELPVAKFLRETADCWHGCIDRWMYARDTDLAHRVGVDGYYVRVAPLVDEENVSRMQASIPVCNVPNDTASSRACDLVSPDALALVRFGMRSADDPRIINTVRVIDALLKVDLPGGPAWHRYNGDGYGEHPDGSPFDGTGQGRAWPLLTGERGHYALAAGQIAEARRLLTAMEHFTSDGGMLPEQSWDTADLPERELFFGQPAGSAMPLVWAHAEYVKLRRSLRDGAVFDLPPQPVRRYLVDRIHANRMIWRFSHKIRTLPHGIVLRIETMAPARVHWTVDDWHTVNDSATRDTGLGVHVVDLPLAGASNGTMIRFTLYWPEVDRWEGRDFDVQVGDGGDG